MCIRDRTNTPPINKQVERDQLNQNLQPQANMEKAADERRKQDKASTPTTKAEYEQYRKEQQERSKEALEKLRRQNEKQREQTRDRERR